MKHIGAKSIIGICNDQVFTKQGEGLYLVYKVKKVREEFERANMPLPVIDESGGGVMAVIKRKTMDEVIKEREGNVGNMSEIYRKQSLLSASELYRLLSRQIL